MKNYLNSDFETAYAKLYGKHFDRFEKMRKYKKKYYFFKNYIPLLPFLVLALIALIPSIFINLNTTFLGYIYILSIFIAYIFFSKFKNNYLKNPEYTETYKKEVITDFIQSILPSFNYIFTIDYTLLNGIYNNYKSATSIINNLINKETTFVATDYFFGTINNMNLSFCDLVTYDKYYESESNYKHLFKGIFAHIKLNYSKNCKIAILAKNNNLPNFKNNISLDNTDFNDNFITISDSPINVFELLTSDIIDLLNTQVLEESIKFDIFIINDNIFFRFHTASILEPSINTNALQKEYFLKDYNLLNFTLNFSEMVNKIYKESNL